MAKLTYLQLVNRVLKRITQAEISDVTAATGHALIISEMINEAQNELWTETNWYSLYKTRKWSTVTYTAATIAFNDAGPDTITDSANGFGSFQDGQQILVSGSTSNDGTWTVNTAVAGTLTLQSADEVTAEALGESITITAITYPVASDWGRGLDMVDITSNQILWEDVIRAFDMDDPNMDSKSNPTCYSFQGSQFRLHPIPAAIYVMRERYWSIPTTLAVNTDTSDLPIECENALIQYALMKVLEYLNKFETADRARMEFERLLKRARSSNSKMIDRLIRFKGNYRYDGIAPPRLPSAYGRTRY